MAPRRVLVPLLYLLGLAVASVVLADRSWKSVTGYQSAYALEREFDSGPTLSERLVLVVLDGLRRDRAIELPAMRALAERGASGSVVVTQPSLSNPARAAIATGSWPEVSGVTNNSVFSPPPVQSIFSLARQQGMQSAIIGSRFWQRAFGEHLVDGYRGFARRPSGYDVQALTSWQTSACEDGLEYLGRSTATLRVIDLTAGDEAGHEFGGDSDGYRRVTAAVDDCLGRLVIAFGGGKTALLAVSDHGHIDRRGQGGHGGDEPEVRLAPFAMAGPGIRTTQPIEAQLVDLAPTISILLGMPIPANNQGRVLWEALEIPDGQREALRELERRQREALREHLPDRESSLAAQRRGRFPASMAVFAWFLLVVVGALRRQSLVAFIIALGAFAGAYYALFYAFGLAYSLSAVVRQEYLYSFFARNVVAASLAYGMAAFCLARLTGGGREAFVRLSLLLTSILALTVTATYYLHGLQMLGWMLVLGPGFKAYLDMLALCGVVLGTVLVLAASLAFPRRLRKAP